MPSFAKIVTIQSTLYIINLMRIGAAHSTPYSTSWRSPSILFTSLDISGGVISQWGPPLEFFLKPEGIGTGGSPHRSVQSVEFNLGGIGQRGASGVPPGLVSSDI